MEEIPVHRVGLFGGGLDRDFLLLAVGDHFGPAGEQVAEPGVAPRGDDFQFGRQSGGGEFEADLVVAFAGGAVCEGNSFFLAGHVYHAARDKRAGDAGAEEVLSFIDSARLDHGEDEVAGKFLLQIHDVTFGSAGLFRLGFKAAKLLLLPDIGAESNDVSMIGFL